MINPASPLEEYLQPLRPFLDDPELTEVCLNKPKQVITQNKDGWQYHDVPDLDYGRCFNLAKLIATHSGQRLDESSPILSATLPGGERAQIVIPPACHIGTVSLTIRKPSNVKLSLSDYESSGAFQACDEFGHELLDYEKELIELNQQHRYKDFLELAVKKRRNIIVSGSTGSGKTTLMKSLIDRIDRDERLLSIENVDELGLYNSHPNTVSLFYSAGGQGSAQVDQQQLLESALRMNPDRVFLAELIRGDEAFYFLRNVNSGHPGSITSMHANSAFLATEQLVLFLTESISGASMTREYIKQLIFMCVDVIVQMNVVNRKRQITEIYYEPAFKRQQMV